MERTEKMWVVVAGEHGVIYDTFAPRRQGSILKFMDDEEVEDDTWESFRRYGYYCTKVSVTYEVKP